MPTGTTTYSFQKPTVGGDSDVWGGHLNDALDKLDDLLDGTLPITPATGLPLEVRKTESATNTVTDALRLNAQSSGTPAAGIGVGLEFAAETGVGNTEVGAVIEAVATDVTSTSEDFDLRFYTMQNGAAAGERLRIASAGQIGIGGGNFGETGQVIRSAGSGASVAWGGLVVMGTSTTASGTSVDFNSIPSWVRRITVNLSGVSLSGTASLLVQLGDSGGVETTGYTGWQGAVSTSSASGAALTNGFVFGLAVAAGTAQGTVTLTAVDASATIWVCQAVIGTGTLCNMVGGTKTLSAALDRVRITTTNGTDTFDAGTINITME